MARPTSRVLALLELFQSGGTRTVAELASRLGVDERTVRRYVDHLRDLDIPVESIRGRYGGYRLSAGYRLPPLMLTDDEALAVLLGLIAAPRIGLVTGSATANETATSKLRRVLPQRLAGRLDALREAVAVTAPPTEIAGPDAGVLLTVADAVRHRRPLSMRYRSASGVPSHRTVHPYGLVAHSGRWYLTGMDTGRAEERTYRLDRIVQVASLPGSFSPPEGFDSAEQVLVRLARAPHRHEVSLRIQAPVEQVRRHLPASVAIVEPLDDANQAGVSSVRVELHVEDLDWVAPALAAIDRPFVVERPKELRARVRDLAARLAASAERAEF